MFSGEKGHEDWLRAVSFAAGTAAFMACIERAVMVSVFVHWRLWAFLALNLLLLAILFTSKSEMIPLKHSHCKNKELKRSKKRIKNCTQKLVSSCVTAVVAPPSPPPPAAEEAEVVKCVVSETKSDESEKLEDYDKLSEEELKQRVEDFIATFRQHLICDAKGKRVMRCGAVVTATTVY